VFIAALFVVSEGLEASGVTAWVAGALLTLGGSPVNVIVHEGLARQWWTRFGYFEFARAGVPLVLATIVVAVLFAPTPMTAPAAMQAVTTSIPVSRTTVCAVRRPVLRAGTPRVGQIWVHVIVPEVPSKRSTPPAPRPSHDGGLQARLK
jgi:hypothetical protein